MVLLALIVSRSHTSTVLSKQIKNLTWTDCDTQEQITDSSYKFLGSAASLLQSERGAQVCAVSVATQKLGTRGRGGRLLQEVLLSNSSCAQVSLHAGAERNFTLCPYWDFLVIYSCSDSGGGKKQNEESIDFPPRWAQMKEWSVRVFWLAGYSLLDAKLLGSMGNSWKKVCVYVHVFKGAE